jgi:hypothetical protein
MKNQLLLLCLVYGLSGGLVYLNPTEPFDLLLPIPHHLVKSRRQPPPGLSTTILFLSCPSLH